MDGFNNGLTSPTSVKPSSVANPSFNGNNENELNPEMASKLKSPSKKQLPTKNFMSPTISAAIKAAVPKKKILAERNETLDVAEQTSHLRSSSFGSKAVKFPVVDTEDDVENNFVAKSSLKPYDPIQNYLSPRPKFLRYNPNRRRKIFLLQENGDNVKSSCSFDAGIPSSGLELGADCSSCTGSFSQKEALEEAEDKIDREGPHKEEEEEEEEEEMVEFGEDRCWSLKGFLEFLLAVIALISTTQAICSMNSPTPSHTLQAVRGFNDWSGKTWSNVYEDAGLNFSEVGRDPTREADLMVGRSKEGEVYHDYEALDIVETIEELVEVKYVDGVYQDEVVREEEATDLLQGLGTPDNEVENDETDVIQDEMWSKQEDTDRLQWIEILQEHEVAASEVIEIYNVEAEREVHDQLLLRADFNQDGVVEEEGSDAENNSQLTTDAKCEIAKDMEDIVEKEIDDIETTDVLISLEGLDLIVAVLIGLPILILISFGVMYHSKWVKSSSPVAIQENNMTEKEEIEDLEPSPNPSSLIQQIEEEPLVNSASLVVHPPQKDVSKETSRIHAPTVELLGEFVFGGEVTSSLRSYGMKGYNISAEADESNSSNVSSIQATTVSSGRTKSSHLEASTRDSPPNTAETRAVKKQRRKNAEASSMVTPSPVRRSSRIQYRSVMSP